MFAAAAMTNPPIHMGHMHVNIHLVVMISLLAVVEVKNPGM
jgi:hypothetical protein